MPPRKAPTGGLRRIGGATAVVVVVVVVGEAGVIFTVVTGMVAVED